MLITPHSMLLLLLVLFLLLLLLLSLHVGFPKRSGERMLAAAEGDAGRHIGASGSKAAI